MTVGRKPLRAEYELNTYISYIVFNVRGCYPKPSMFRIDVSMFILIETCPRSKAAVIRLSRVTGPRRGKSGPKWLRRPVNLQLGRFPRHIEKTRVVSPTVRIDGVIYILIWRIADRERHIFCVRNSCRARLRRSTSKCGPETRYYTRPSRAPNFHRPIGFGLKKKYERHRRGIVKDIPEKSKEEVGNLPSIRDRDRDSRWMFCGTKANFLSHRKKLPVQFPPRPLLYFDRQTFPYFILFRPSAIPPFCRCIIPSHDGGR